MDAPKPDLLIGIDFGMTCTGKQVLHMTRRPLKIDSPMTAIDRVR